MSNLSRNRKMKLLAGAVMAGACTVPSMVKASPFVFVTMLGRDTGPAGNLTPAFTNDLGTVAPGDTIQFQLFVKMASVGTTNSTAPAATITSLTTAGSVDGVNSLTFDAFQQTTAGAQGDFKMTRAAVTSPTSQASPAEGVSLVTAFHNAPGASGGVLAARGNGNNDLVTIRPVRGAGNFAGAGASAVLMGTGAFVITSVALGVDPLVKMRWNAAGAGGIHINAGGAGTQSIFPSNGSETGLDPYVSFIGLGPVPEPGSLSLLAIGAAGLLARRKNKKA